MPNHFLTIGLCGRDYKRLEAIGKEDYDEIDFEPFIITLGFKWPRRLTWPSQKRLIRGSFATICCQVCRITKKA